MKLNGVCLIAFCALFSLSAYGADLGAERHVKRGVACQQCHGPDMKKPKEPSDKDCLACHDRALLIKKTENLNASANPHNPPHNGECILCHIQHDQPVNNCAECHNFEFKVK